MEPTRKTYIWGIILFGTLIGLNETVIGSFDIQYKAVILSTITLSLFALARFYIPRVGSSLLIMAIALLFKLTSMGPYLCKPAAVFLLGAGFEFFAFVFTRKGRFTYQSYILTCVLSSLVVFAVFGLLETYIIKNEYWISEKFNDYVFIQGPMTAVTSALLTVAGLWLISRPKLNFIHLLSKKPLISQIILGLFILTIWIAGIVTV